MSMLSKLLAMPRAELKSRLQAVDTSAVKGRGLRRKFEKIRAKEGGFTLLELLVVVAILAAIAGTASLMLHDTDRRAAAGAHVFAMGQIANSVMTWPLLNGGKFPPVWDSLLTTPATSGGWLSIVSPDLTGQLKTEVLTDKEVDLLREAGITSVRGIDTNATTGCSGDLQALIETKTNDIVPANIYQPKSVQEGKGGCGAAVPIKIAADTASGDPATYADKIYVAKWDNNKADPVRVGAPASANLIAFGVSAGVSLLDRTQYGGLTATPIYRHVEAHEYPGYIVLFNVSEEGGVTFQAVIDGAGDTKDEELGELDNLRET